MRTLGRVTALGALALLLSACLKLDIDFEVSADDTVSGSVIFAVDKDLPGAFGQSLDEMIADSGFFPVDHEGVTVEDYEDDEFVGRRVTLEAVPISEFSDAHQGAGFGIVRQGDVFFVSGYFDLSQLGIPTGPTGPVASIQPPELRIRLTFPGEVSRAPGGEIDGNSVTWVLELGRGTTIQATASAIDDNPDLTLLVLVGGVLIAIGIVVGVAMSQRRRLVSAGNAPAFEAPAPSPDQEPAAPPDGLRNPAREPDTPAAPPGVPPPPLSEPAKGS